MAPGTEPRLIPRAVVRLLVAGGVCTLVGLVGLAATAGRPDASRTLVRLVFIPAYAVGALLLVVAGVWWARAAMKKR